MKHRSSEFNEPHDSGLPGRNSSFNPPVLSKRTNNFIISSKKQKGQPLLGLRQKRVNQI